MSSGLRTRKRRPRICSTTSSSSVPRLSSAETVAEIDDLLIQILSLVPIKALLRCKCVSKRWLSLITNPNFSYHIISSKPSVVSGLFLRRNSFTSMEYEFLSLVRDDGDDRNSINRSVSPPFKSPLRLSDHPSDMTILQSCNGLLLCQCSCPNHYNRNYYVYNPTTKQSTLLPPINGLSHRVVGISLAFDPSKSPHYKVVCLRACDRTSDLFRVEVYSSIAGPWRLSGSPFTLPPTIKFGNTVFWNNAVHWFGHLGVCVSFDMEREEIRVLPLPHLDPEDEQDIKPFSLMDESGGHLYFVEVYDPSSSQFSVFKMETDGSGWSPKYNVDLEPIAAAFPEMISSEYYTDGSVFEFSVISIVREEDTADDDDAYIVMCIPPDKVIRYNFKDKTFEELHQLKQHQDSDFYGIHGSFKFVESLACV
ncbi:PREDICTED: F-box protein At5g07610 [Tarenaya hassleriana]|uniref:F-box protein At5g07610 n=1 Tax=Tarenaya hassleriana TaxID=28532 RepID=UPI00053C94C1|nr:PREDICTED: F-box protein At5g07610 [Tarenaya hassleriana]